MKHKHKRGDERGAVRPTEAREKLRALHDEFALLPSVATLPENASWSLRAPLVTQVRKLLRECAPLRNRGNDDEQALAKALYDRLLNTLYEIAAWMYPPVWDAAWKALERGDIAGIEPLIEFLEADPYFNRSGYIKEVLIPKIIRLPRDRFPSAWIARLQTGVLTRVRTYWGREFRFYVRLARFVDDTALHTALEQIAGEFYTGPDGEAPARARHILRHLPPV